MMIRASVVSFFDKKLKFVFLLFSVYMYMKVFLSKNDSNDDMHTYLHVLNSLEGK